MTCKWFTTARVACISTILLTAFLGCAGDEKTNTGGGLDGAAKRDVDRNAMKLERVTRERDEYKVQVEQLMQENATLKNQLRGRTPTTRS